jgi:signal transduction histidine kinase
VDGEDELATLAHAFNYAAEHLQESYANLKAAHDQLAAELKERIRAEREVQALSERLISVQEDERARIARELHDDLSQQIGVLSITASNLKQHLPGAAAEAHEHIERLRQKLVQLAQSVRQLSHQLHPVILEHGGLAAALRSYCAEFSSLNGISVVCYAADKFEDLSSEAALCIYRVVQEALQNVAKHAATKEATVQLTRLERHVSLVVADRGAGCSSGRISKGLGLVSMKERVRVVSGTFEFKSEPEKGTTVMVQIPLAKEE